MNANSGKHKDNYCNNLPEQFVGCAEWNQVITHAYQKNDEYAGDNITYVLPLVEINPNKTGHNKPDKNCDSTQRRRNFFMNFPSSRNIHPILLKGILNNERQNQERNK